MRTEKEPLHLRLAKMEPEAIVSDFSEALAADLAEEGMSAEDLAHVRAAAAEIMRLCGIVAPKKTRRVTGAPRRPTSPEKLALQRAKREAAKAQQAAKVKPAIVDPNDQEQREDLTHIRPMPMGERGRRHFAFVRHAGTPQDATSAEADNRTDDTRDAATKAA